MNRETCRKALTPAETFCLEDRTMSGTHSPFISSVMESHKQPEQVTSATLIFLSTLSPGRPEAINHPVVVTPEAKLSIVSSISI